MADSGGITTDGDREAEEQKAMAAARKLPMGDRLTHKIWKVRSEACEDLAKAAEAALSPTDPALDEPAENLAKCAGDSNATVMDKGLEAAASVLTRGGEQHAARCAEGLCKAIMSKGLVARPGTLKKAEEVLLLLVEQEQQGQVVEALVQQGFAHKTPKAVAAAVNITLAVFDQFGARAVKPTPVLSKLPALFDSRDAKVRDGAKKLTVLLGRWVGREAVEGSLMEKMRDAMKKDVQGWLADLPDEKPKAQRFTRKEQARRKAKEEAAAKAGADGSEGAEEGSGAASGAPSVAVVVPDDEEEEDCGLDAWEISEPKDVLKELKGDFWSGLKSAKWKERKDAMAALRALLKQNPRLEPGADYHDVTGELKKVVTKDSNVACVAEAVHCVGAVAKGLRGPYKAQAKDLYSHILDKFKEKNSAVVSACHEALGNMEAHSFQLLDVMDDTVAALKHNNPKVRQETLKFLLGAVRSRDEAHAKKLHKALLPPLAKAAAEPTPALRDAAMLVLAEFASKAGSMAPLEKATAALDDAKKKKLTSMAQARINGEDPAAAASVPLSPIKSPSAASSRPSSAAAASSRPSSAGSAPAAKKAGGAASSRAGGGASSRGESNQEPQDDPVALASSTPKGEEAAQKLADAAGDATVAALRSSAWKERLDAVNDLRERAAEMCSSAGGADAVVFGVASVPGFGEKHFQVLGKAFELCGDVAGIQGSGFGKAHAFSLLSGVVEKISDAKLKGPGTSALSAASEAVGPQFVIKQLHMKASKHNNPKIHCESVEWIKTAVADFGLPACGKGLVDMAKTSLESPNAAVRTAATGLVTTMHMTAGDALLSALRPSLKPALMATIEAECAKSPGPPPEPSRTARAGVPAAAAAASSSSKANGGAGPGAAKAPSKRAAAVAAAAAAADDLGLERADISGLITPDIVKRLGSTAWKERQGALQEVIKIVDDAGGRIQPSTGDLLPALKQRLKDSNVALVAGTMTLLGAICRAMGPPFERQCRSFLDDVVKNLGDNKKPVREAALSLLNEVIGIGAGPVVFQEIADGLRLLKVESGKVETLAWLRSKVTEGFADEPISIAATAKVAVAGVEDKSGAVRTAGSGLLDDLVGACGGSEVIASLRELDDASRRAAMPHVTKAAGSASGPASPTGASRPGSAAPGGRSSAVRSSTSTAARPGSAPAQRKGTVAAASSSSSVRASRAGGTPPLSPSSGSLAQDAAAQEPGCPFAFDDKKMVREKRCRGGFKPLVNVSEESAELEAAMVPVVLPGLHRLMFHKDCGNHMKACDQIAECLSEETAPAAAREGLHGSLDRVLHWLRIRMSDGNTQCLVRTLDTVSAIFADMRDRQIPLTDFEASIILPALADKSGHNQDRIRQKHRELLAMSSEICERRIKLADALLEGARSKNNRTRVECIEEMGCLVERSGEGMTALKVSGKEKVLPTIARLVSERDKALRAAVLGTLAIVYTCEGDVVWKQMGNLDSMQKSLIEDRFKATDKEALKSGTVIGATRAQRQAAAGGAPESGKPPQPQSAALGNGNGSVSRPPAAAAAPAASIRSVQEVQLQPPQQQQHLAAASFAAPALQESSAFPPGALAGAPDNALMRESVAIPAPTAPQRQQAAAATPARPPPAPQRGGAAPGVPPNATPVMSTPSLMSQQQRATSASGTPRPAAAIMAAWRSALGQLKDDQDLLVAVEGMKVLCFELMDASDESKGPPPPEAVELFASSADGLVADLAVKVDMVFGEATSVLETTGAAPSSRACKYVLNTLMQMYQFPDRQLALRVSGPSVKALMAALLVRLLDERVNGLQEGQQLLKALNVLMLKILEHSNRTHVFVALTELLRTPPPSMASPPATAQRFSDLVVKCLIKLTKQLAAFIGELDVGTLLAAIHGFLSGLGAEEIRRRGAEDDKPLRMIKTVLHEVCKVEGHGIRVPLNEVVPVTEGLPDGVPIIHNYVDLNLQTLAAANLIPKLPVAPLVVPPSPPSPASPAHGVVAARSAVSPQQQQQQLQPSQTPNGGAGTPVVAAAQALPSPPRSPNSPASTAAYSPPGAGSPSSLSHAGQEAKQELAAIFKTIGDRNNTERGLEELYFFHRSNPDIDIGVHLSRTSEAFRRYIQSGLERVEQREKRRALQPLHQQASSGAASAAGEHPQGGGSQPVVVVAPAASSVNGNGNPRPGTQNMDELRERMRHLALEMPNGHGGGGGAAGAGGAQQQPQGASPVRVD